jgi:hypothetical protein
MADGRWTVATHDAAIDEFTGTGICSHGQVKPDGRQRADSQRLATLMCDDATMATIHFGSARGVGENPRCVLGVVVVPT